MSKERIKELGAELKKLGIKEKFISWAADKYPVSSATIRTGYLSRAELPEQEVITQSRFINDMEKYIKDNS